MHSSECESSLRRESCVKCLLFSLWCKQRLASFRCPSRTSSPDPASLRFLRCRRPVYPRTSQSSRAPRTLGPRERACPSPQLRAAQNLIRRRLACERPWQTRALARTKATRVDTRSWSPPRSKSPRSRRQWRPCLSGAGDGLRDGFGRSLPCNLGNQLVQHVLENCCAVLDESG